MKNKHVGFLLLGLVIVFFFVVMSFNNALAEIVSVSCTHGVSCPMQITLQTQKVISYSLLGLIAVVGLFISFFLKEKGENPQIATEDKVNEDKPKREIDIGSLDEDEKSIMQIVMREGSAYQSDVIKETGLSKVKISRTLDKLQGKGLIERKRRGMTNIIILQ